jgi:hypothetical protein
MWIAASGFAGLLRQGVNGCLVSWSNLDRKTGGAMEQQQLSQEELERLAAAMAQAIPDLECPDCCDCDGTYWYVERSAELYQEEWEWACLATTLVRCRARARRSG